MTGMMEFALFYHNFESNV